MLSPEEYCDLFGLEESELPHIRERMSEVLGTWRSEVGASQALDWRRVKSGFGPDMVKFKSLLQNVSVDQAIEIEMLLRREESGRDLVHLGDFMGWYLHRYFFEAINQDSLPPHRLIDTEHEGPSVEGDVRLFTPERLSGASTIRRTSSFRSPFRRLSLHTASHDVDLSPDQIESNPNVPFQLGM